MARSGGNHPGASWVPIQLGSLGGGVSAPRAYIRSRNQPSHDVARPFPLANLESGSNSEGSGTPPSSIASQRLANDSEDSPVPRLSPSCPSSPLRSLADGHNPPRPGCNDAVQHGELPHCSCLHTNLFTLPPLPLLTDRGGVPTVPHSHYSHNDVAVVARFCYWLGGGLTSYFRRIPCSTICARS